MNRTDVDGWCSIEMYKRKKIIQHNFKMLDEMLDWFAPTFYSEINFPLFVLKQNLMQHNFLSSNMVFSFLADFENFKTDPTCDN